MLAGLVFAEGCATWPDTVVRKEASRDLRCPESAIEVTKVASAEGDLWWVNTRRKHWSGTYRAEGCGARATYRCDQWDAYNQVAICEPGE